MKLKNDKINLGWGVGFLLLLIAIVINLDIRRMVASNNLDILSVSLVFFFLLFAGILVAIGFLRVFPFLGFFGPRRIGAKYYEIKPIYYNKNGPKGSDAVICLIRSSIESGWQPESEWQPKIVALNHFIPEEAEKIRDLFNLKTGEAVKEEYLTVKIYSAQKGKILLFVKPEEIQEREFQEVGPNDSVNHEE
jgi:hypothetical protein